MSRPVISLIGILLIAAAILVISTLRATEPYVTHDGIYSATISGHTVSLEFIDDTTLNIYTNPGHETYKYDVDENIITLTDKYTGETTTYNFQYIKDENVIVFDDIRYMFWPTEG